ncbi:MAG: hypothetical protein F6K35_09325 [Okeania sp. SIO2H7]|nr:hypothetical protein [Okeania sp. SIO2H7]
MALVGENSYQKFFATIKAVLNLRRKTKITNGHNSQRKTGHLKFGGQGYQLLKRNLWLISFFRSDRRIS